MRRKSRQLNGLRDGFELVTWRARSKTSEGIEEFSRTPEVICEFRVIGKQYCLSLHKLAGSTVVTNLRMSLSLELL